ncbi:Nicotinamidase [Nakaseomyces bracarensis]|uniref:nicotinamidase n=1 Tax=Nakaseomyces bracarensis TaxID=273131 RepID=A0ABR4NS35_9SACH
MKTLLVIDMQNDFAKPNGSLYVPEGEKVIEPIVELMKDPQWHRVVVTRDWHPPNHVSFARTHGKPDFSEIEYQCPKPGDDSHQTGVLWPVHCVQNSTGAQLAPEILETVQEKHIKIVDKGYLPDREYYSAFNDIWDWHHTELDEYLKKHHTTEVYVVGLALDYCVMNTAISAANLGYDTTILKSYTKAIYTDDEHKKQLHEKLEKNNVKLQ